MELLFSASAIGIRLRGAGSTRFKSEDPLLALPNEGAVYVHQGLHKGLNIVEARRPTDSPTEEDEAISEDDPGLTQV